MLASAKCRVLMVNENKQSIQFASSDIVGSEITTVKAGFVWFFVLSAKFCTFQTCLFLHSNSEAY